MRYGKSFPGERIRERASWDEGTAREKSQKCGKEQCVWGIDKPLKRRPQMPARMSSQRPLSHRATGVLPFKQRSNVIGFVSRSRM